MRWRRSREADDASATLPWCFADEATGAINALLTRLRSGDEAIVPAHWLLEVANALLIAARRRRITDEDVHRFLQDLEIPSNSNRNDSQQRSSRENFPAR